MQYITNQPHPGRYRHLPICSSNNLLPPQPTHTHHHHFYKMPTYPEMRIKSAKYAKNINKRGKVGPLTSRPQGNSSTGPIIVAVLLFILVGSGIIQILRGQFF